LKFPFCYFAPAWHHLFFHSDIKTAVNFTLGLLLALVTTSNPAKGEERVLSFNITAKSVLAFALGLIISFWVNNLALFLVIKPSLREKGLSQITKAKLLFLMFLPNLTVFTY